MTMHGHGHAELRFDGRDPRLLVDPYRAYAELRDAGGVCRGGIGQWVVSRHEDVSRLLRDPRLGKTMPESYVRFSTGDDEISSFAVRQNLGRRDRAASRLLARAFSGALVGRMGAPMRARAEGLLRPVAERGHMDVVRDLALPFQAAVMSDLAALPPGDWTEVWPRVRCLVDAFSDAFFGSAQRSAEASAALRWLREYLGALLDWRRRAPGDDLVSRLLQADEEGRRLGDDEIVDNVITILYAGTETSMGMISNGVAALGRDAAQFARLRSDPGLVAGAVEELLRVEAPIQVTTRVVLEPVIVGETKIRPGRVALLLLGSANHDGDQFPAPERLDVARDPNPHLSFGGGHYYCLGAALARAEGRAVLESLVARFGRVEVCGRPARSHRYNFRSFAELEVAVEPVLR